MQSLTVVEKDWGNCSFEEFEEKLGEALSKGDYSVMEIDK